MCTEDIANGNAMPNKSMPEESVKVDPTVGFRVINAEKTNRKTEKKIRNHNPRIRV